MSIIVKDPVDGHIKMFTKGADSIIKARLDNSQLDKRMWADIDTFLNKASAKGLRTLLMAMRVIDPDEFKDFNQRVAEAERDVMKRDKLLADIFDDFERGLVLLGATAVEDRLQDNVPSTIHDLQDAGIKIWMLTGDKLETAENIGYSCKLLSKEMEVWKISSQKEVDDVCSPTRVKLNSELIKQQKKRGLLVEATALSIILSNMEYKKHFLKIAKSCEGVICCRVSPGQKADVVRLIKQDDNEAVTLAIGDGANDVSMILEAHIGVGLYGNEGMRAV
jgi:phospholipid-transporting ATPase